jgi:hypothetical protein
MEEYFRHGWASLSAILEDVHADPKAKPARHLLELNAQQEQLTF